MDNSIVQLNEITQNIFGKLYGCSYEEISDYVDQRQILINKVEQLSKLRSLSLMEKIQIQEILNLDLTIVNRMEQLKTEASSWLQQRELAKVQRSAYESGYNAESILMDQKK